MYTRNYRIQKDCRADTHSVTENTPAENTSFNEEKESSNAPATDKNTCTVIEDPKKCEEFSEQEKPRVSAKRFKATRLPRLDSIAEQSVLELPARACDEICPEKRCEKEPSFNLDPNDCACEKTVNKGERHILSSLFRTCGSDVMLILALIVLLMLEGGDDILILTLCFILS